MWLVLLRLAGGRGHDRRLPPSPLPGVRMTYSVNMNHSMRRREPELT